MNRNDRRWLILVGAGLLVLSIVIYGVNYAIFRDARNIFFYLFIDLAFLPLEVLIIGLVVERLISLRERQALQHKLNMVIGAFFSELGTSLLAELLPALCAVPQISECLDVKSTWTKQDFLRASRSALSLDCRVDLDQIDLEALKSHLISQRSFMLRLLENPNLMEHERFTDVLWAVLHLEEELEARASLEELRPADEAHLQGDVRRAFDRLMAEWVLYVGHLKEDYPYLFSLVLRMHPFQEAPSPTVTG
jgi:hypothetical protein